MSELTNKTRPIELEVTAKKVINTGNYESMSFSASLRLSLAPGEDIDKVYHRAYKKCEKAIIREAMDQGIVQ